MAVTPNPPSSRALALVTGASAGIGYELARQFVRHGYDLVATGRSEGIEQAAEDLSENGAQVIPVRADLASYDGVEAVWHTVLDTGRPLEAAALNAGASIGGAFTDTDLTAELDLISLNVTSVVHLAKRVVQHRTGSSTA